MPPTNHIAHSTSADAEFDALADLFLGERTNGASHARSTPAAPASPRAASPAPRTAIDLVVQGHLPVRAGPWIARYAAERAAMTDATVALIRLHQGHATVDLIAPRPAEPAAPARAASLDAAISGAITSSHECIVAAEAVEEIGLAARDGISAVTVLTAPNEAAVVEAYRVIKALGACLATRPDAGEGVTLRIAVMGADADRADQVRRKLSDAAHAFIGREVELAASAERIEPTAASNLFRGDTDLPAPELVDRILRAAAAPPPPPPQPAAPVATAVPPSPARPAPVIARPIAPGPRPTAPPPAAPATTAAEPIALHTGPLPDPVALIPGLTAVALPSAPDAAVRIARDARAGLHLIRLDADSPERALAGLLAVEAWITANRALIEMALGAPITGDPSLHLITERMDSARALLGTRVRVHALVRATGPFAAVALNAPA
jgi:hypothetical protein